MKEIKIPMNRDRIKKMQAACFFLTFCISISSCKKFVDIDPPVNQLVAENVFTDDVSATATVAGIYSKMLSNTGFSSGSNNSIAFLADLSSDELTNYSSNASQVQFYQNSLNSTNPYVKTYLWTMGYQYIYAVNAVIEQIPTAKGVSFPVKQQLIGESKFIRAFCNFYLVNLFGDIPLITSTDYRQNAVASRMPKVKIYEQIINDLKDAQGLLNANYVSGPNLTVTAERVRPNRFAATALLARAYLYNGDFVQAEEQSNVVINNTATYSIVNNLNNVFLGTSLEAIWQLKPVTPGINTYEGNIFILNSAPSSHALSNFIISAFEPGDKRKMSWVNSVTASGVTYYYPYKYKVASSSNLTEYSMVLRLAEQYLIRAEARIQQGKLSEALNDINVIRLRAGLPLLNVNDKPSVFAAIQHERQVEFFCEWGHRWLDLKRTNSVDTVMSVVTKQKGGTWNVNAQLYPIPLAEMQNDQNLNQNPGY